MDAVQCSGGSRDVAFVRQSKPNSAAAAALRSVWRPRLAGIQGRAAMPGGLTCMLTLLAQTLFCTFSAAALVLKLCWLANRKLGDCIVSPNVF